MTTKTLKVTLVKSLFGQLASNRNSARGLGLRRIGHSVEVADTPSNRGMINAASHMLLVEGAMVDGKGVEGKRVAGKGSEKR